MDSQPLKPKRWFDADYFGQKMSIFAWFGVRSGRPVVVNPVQRPRNYDSDPQPGDRGGRFALPARRRCRVVLSHSMTSAGGQFKNQHVDPGTC